MLDTHQRLVVNAIGNLAGAIVFSIFLVLVLRGGAGRRLRQDWLSIASAGLALIWNTGSFAALFLPAGNLRWFIEAIDFSVLSLLPAVLLHLFLTRKTARLRLVVNFGYALSATAIALHIAEAFQPDLGLHKLALWVITAGFAALTLGSAVAILLERGSRGNRGASRILASMCLLLFAVSFSHFGSEQAPQTWSTELILHHAGIPVALAILLRDYRFIFLDAFIRFLANVILAAVLAVAGVRLTLRLWPAGNPPSLLPEMLTVASLCGILILFAYLRTNVQSWLTRVVFRGANFRATARELRAGATELSAEDAYLPWAAQRIAAHAGSHMSEWIADGPSASIPRMDYPSLAGDIPWLRAGSRWNWVEVVVPIRLSQDDIRHLLLGGRDGGRRYLSDDLRALSDLAATVAEEVARLRTAEMQRLVAEAELRALQAQINPHFLFNALNALYGIIPREAAGARRTVLNLSDIFRYFLQADKIFIPLSEELKIVKAYLEIEQLRLGPRLQTAIEIDPAVLDTPIPILSIQPLVENAIKHGISRHSSAGWLRLSAKLTDHTVHIAVEDTRSASDAPPLSADSKGAGVGLANVTRRLQLCYGPQAGVTFTRKDFGALVEFFVPLSRILPDQPAHDRFLPAGE